MTQDRHAEPFLRLRHRVLSAQFPTYLAVSLLDIVDSTDSAYAWTFVKSVVFVVNPMTSTVSERLSTFFEVRNRVGSASARIARRQSASAIQSPRHRSALHLIDAYHV